MGMLVKFPARIVYTMAFKEPSTANDRDLNLLKRNFVFSNDGHFISSKFGVDPWRNNQATCVQKSANRQTDSFLSLYV